MKMSLGKLFSFGVLALALTACGNSGTNSALYPTTAANGYQTGTLGAGSMSLGFSGSGSSISQTSVLAGVFPMSTRLGNYGQLNAGANNFATNSGAMIQFQPKQGVNGILQMYAGQNSVYGTIQLSQSIVQQIASFTGGQNVQVTSMAIWSTHTLSQTSVQTYTGNIAQAIVYLYINVNGTSQPYGPIVF